MLAKIYRRPSSNFFAQKILSAIRSNHTEYIIPDAINFASEIGDSARDAVALCAHVLAKNGYVKPALDWWDKSAGVYPHKREWLEAALRFAWQNGDSQDYTQKWLDLAAEVFISPPSLPFIAEAMQRGWRPKGAIGTHAGRLKGWLLWPKGENFSFSMRPAQKNANLELKNLGSVGGSVLYAIDYGLENLAADVVLHVKDKSGSHIKGSPLVISPPRISGKSGRQLPPPKGGLTIIMPVYSDRVATMRCLGSLFASVKKNRTPARILVAWDHGPDKRLGEDLHRLARKGKISLVIPPHNMGFLGAVNFTLRLVPAGDVVLLNSDTLVHGDWLDRLAAHAAANEKTATITALGTNAEHMSFPHWNRSASITTLRQTALLDAACGGLDRKKALVEIPVGVGFCMLVTRRALNAIGLLDGREVCRGYAEEVDFCLRAKKAELKNYAAFDVFVAHLGGKSFGAAKQALAAQNNAAVLRRFPNYRRVFNIFLHSAEPERLRAEISRRACRNLRLPQLLHIYAARSKFIADWEADNEKQKVAGNPALYVRKTFAGWKAVLSVRGDFPLADMTFQLPEEQAELKNLLHACGVTKALFHDEGLIEVARALDLAYESPEPPDKPSLTKLPSCLENGNYLLLPPQSSTHLGQILKIAAQNCESRFFMPFMKSFCRGMRQLPNLEELPVIEDLTPYAFLAIVANNKQTEWHEWLHDHGCGHLPVYGICAR